MAGTPINRLKIAYVTATDATDRRSWSGTPYFIARALQQHCGDVHFIGPVKSNVEPFAKLASKGVRVLSMNRKRYRWMHSTVLSKRHGKAIGSMLSRERFDLVFAPAASTELAYLSTDIPVVYLSDATFSLLIDYHKRFSNLMRVSIREGNAIEASAIQKASLILYSSEWAAESAVNDYGVDRNKIRVIPFGANIENVLPADAVLSERLRRAKTHSEKCKLLFLAVNWEEKGGPVAFDTLLELEKIGVDAELTVCGCTPPARFSHIKLNVIPFLDKNTQEGRDGINQLLLDADFLLLPTRHDCTPIVFCEANAFGLPIITSGTGGIPSVIRNGVNGFMLPLEANGEEYAKLIKRICADGTAYAELTRNSRAEFDSKLNWDSWGAAVKAAIEEVLGYRIS